MEPVMTQERGNEGASGKRDQIRRSLHVFIHNRAENLFLQLTVVKLAVGRQPV